ncbi:MULTISPECIES: peroxiredoxin [Stenotrophomonas]|jgi:peroxiredoxin Q/BCP|uniref:thioredoxin-dependent peroxiredoxin n=1 Tax=Stenotrophomonas acidaminiphila TaxID=128780 RepID=A0A0R0DTI5_9GAMM|nr:MULTISPECIES: peroxiredoxin [Stenotrophomonas]ODU46028.1 MAG: thiol peroxidase [Xanthomonadaceae bacterium SCN 69-123]OJY73736.1 MAG: peroxiredoxin [Stenotrophomonas sp. 69-14]OZB53469.1 MAG: peroxiredoxin [Stenotrophomonas sp. 14-69-23]ALJ28624.1 AhpC/TSA family protein [Stenotrophomonas acidaminiphila]KRG85453.1 thiol peroxidase [Stenotrophomonas acidaminiphila]
MNIGDTLDRTTLELPLALSGGATTTLAAQAGHWLVLYFYPKDSTPGCTTEGIDFNALLPQFKRAGAVVFGVSRDSVRSHDNFCAKQGFGFPLVSDADEALCTAFDVIRMKNMYGKQVRGIERSTFLVSPDGTLVQAWRKVKVAGHAQAVLDALKAARSK